MESLRGRQPSDVVASRSSRGAWRIGVLDPMNDARCGDTITTNAASASWAHEVPSSAEVLSVATADLDELVVMRFDVLGDLALTVPMLSEVKRLLPHARLTVVGGPLCADLLRGQHLADRVVSVSQLSRSIRQRRWVKQLVPDPARRELLRRYSADGLFPLSFHRAIRGLEWEGQRRLVITPKFGYYPWWIDLAARMIPSDATIGYLSDVDWPARRPRRRWLSDVVVASEGTRHEVIRNLDLLCALGLTPEARWPRPSATSAGLESRSVPGWIGGGRTIALGIGASHPRREWPARRFAELARWILGQPGYGVALVGGSSESSRASQIEHQIASPRALNLVGKTSVSDLLAVLGRCVAFVGCDSGPMHLASWAQTPIVEVSCHPSSGSSGSAQSPERFGPWRIEARIVQPTAPRPGCVGSCTSAMAHCITQVGSSVVIDALASVLASEPKHTVGGR
jgi:ADP-heptose:LPS heptosyltransferase